MTFRNRLNEVVTKCFSNCCVRGYSAEFTALHDNMVLVPLRERRETTKFTKSIHQPSSALNLPTKPEHIIRHITYLLQYINDFKH